MALFGPRNGPRVNGARPAHVAALDIGSSKVVCFISPAEPGAAVEGVGVAPSKGVRAGAVVDMEETERAIRAAVEQAERMAGVAVNRVTASFSGGHLAARRIAAETQLSEREVTDRDLRRCLDAALGKFDAEGRVILHALPTAWSIDDHRGVRDPRGMFGMRLGVELQVVHAAAGPVRNLSLCVERAQLELRSIVATPYASGLSTLVDDEIELGATIIDMGAGATSVAVFQEGALVHVDVVPIGGALISSDLARGLSTPIAAAERLKCMAGATRAAPEDDRQLVRYPQLGEADGVARSAKSDLAEIILPRIEETLEFVRNRLEAAGMLEAAGKRLVLTGAASELAGVAEEAERILEKRVRLGRPIGLSGVEERFSGPGYATVAGLLRHTLQGPREAAGGAPKPAPATRWPKPAAAVASASAAAPGGLMKAANWLRENF